MSDAIKEAESLGAEITYSCGRWSWRRGMRSSADQYAITFKDRIICAKHFLETREAQLARQAALSSVVT